MTFMTLDMNLQFVGVRGRVRSSMLYILVFFFLSIKCKAYLKLVKLLRKSCAYEGTLPCYTSSIFYVKWLMKCEYYCVDLQLLSMLF